MGPTKEDCISLKEALGLSRRDGSVGIGMDNIHVYIFNDVKKPPVTVWHGWPIVYHIGVGRPGACDIAPSGIVYT